MRYRVVPWRGLVSGNMYFRIDRAGLLLWRKVVDCFSEQEANEMIAKLRKWNEPEPRDAVSSPSKPL